EPLVVLGDRRLVDEQEAHLRVVGHLLGIEHETSESHEVRKIDGLVVLLVTRPDRRIVVVAHRGSQLRPPRRVSCASYASTISCTMRWRTTSRLPSSTNSSPGMPSSTSRTCKRPLRPRPSARSICVTSPVTTHLLPKPSRVRNIFICSAVVFCASSRMMKLSL